MFRGNVKIGAMNVECHVLNDLRRRLILVASVKLLRVLSGGRESGNLARYLNRNPLFQENLSSAR